MKFKIIKFALISVFNRITADLTNYFHGPDVTHGPPVGGTPYNGMLYRLLGVIYP